MCAHLSETWRQFNDAVLQQCPTDLVVWTDNQTCVNANLCDASNGRCVTPNCLYPNTFRCQGSTRQLCDDATRKWLDVTTCATGQICDLTNASGCLGTCPTVPTRCNTVGTQTDAQVCTLVNNLPQWQSVQTCATAALCNTGEAGASCAPPTCAVDQSICDGNTLKRCNTGRTGWDTVTTCATGQVCDAPGKRCDICTPNTYACNSSLQLLKCSPDGQLNTVVHNCPSADLCYTSMDMLTGHCIRCVVGNAQCSGTTQVQSCLTDRSGWDTATPCANGCQDNPGSADYCAACPTAGEIQCVQTGAPGSTKMCSSDRQTWSSAATCAKGLGCVNSGIADYCSGVCPPNASECLAGIGTPGTSLTGQHTCGADGKGWGATTSECLDSSNLKTCVSGALTTTKTPCPTNTPYCANGQCEACTGTSTKCDTTRSNTLLTCNNGTWASSPCTGDNSVCSNGACVACTSASSASSATCPTTATRSYCAGNDTWATSTCATVDSAKPYCENGTCVACLNSYTPICTDSNTKVQSCSNGRLAKTKCSGVTPVCYAGSAGAVCSACDDSTSPICLSDGVTRETCVKGSYAQLPCTDANSSYCLNGVCAGCNATAPTNCPSNTTVKTCSSSGTWVTTACNASTPVCGGSPSQCVQCNDSSLFKCSGLGSVSTTRHSCLHNVNADDTCRTGQICYPAASTSADAMCKAPACAVNQYKCTGQLLQKCNGSGTGWDQVTCSSRQSCNATTGTCDTIICSTGTFQCTSNTLQACNTSGTAWVNPTICATGQYCNSTTGTCDPVICTASTQKKCTGNTLQTCNGAGTGWVDTTTCTSGSQICNATAGTCDPVICTASTQKTCTGNTLEACNSTGTAWVDTICTSSQRCNATAGTCDPVICTASTQKTCTGNTLEACNSTGTAWVDTICTSSQRCNATAGTCDPVVCATNELSCADKTPQICSTTLTGWIPNGSPCAGATPICSVGACVACTSSLDCSGVKPVCAFGVCLACASNSDCLVGSCQSDGSCS